MRFLKKYLIFEIRLKMVHCKQSKIYYIKMAGKLANLNLVRCTDYFFRNIATNLANMKVFINKNSQNSPNSN